MNNNHLSHPVSDFRSDTVTRPTPEMRAAMAAAPLGDDVYGEDPSVNALQERIAALLGKEAALYVPSGTMSNQIGLRVHCSPGDEFICDEGCHIFNYEQAAYAQLSGLAARTVAGQNGVIQPHQLEGLVRPPNVHAARTRLLCLENTHNRGAGRITPLETSHDNCAWARHNGLATHLDGARLFNAVVATGVAADRWAQPFDTVSVCFSKGLGAPVGSALTGPRELIAKALRARKLFGGAMRQAGVIAAAALYALDHHIDRLAEDHRHARQLAAAIEQIDGLTLTPTEIDTNIVIFHVAPELASAAEFAARLTGQGVLMLAISPTQIRAVTHLDVDDADVARAIEAISLAIDAAPTTSAPVASASY